MPTVVGNIELFAMQIVQYFKHENLSLFELAIIAELVHKTNPTYAILSTQCYYLFCFGICNRRKILKGPSFGKRWDKFQPGLVEIRGSPHLTKRYGRWNGLKVTNVDIIAWMDSPVVHAILARFKTEYQDQLAEIRKPSQDNKKFKMYLKR